MKAPCSAPGEFLQTLADHVAQSAKETLGVGPELAEAHGNEVAMLMATVWGGQVLYMPKGIHLQASKLHQQLFDEFSGRNQRELARKHNLSLAFVYKVIKRMRLAIIARDQGDLFASLEEDDEE
ncbi:Mor transcription activator family protein [Pseudomonas protegens]|uniref:Mor transcription activator family protein n=1 Tax=Pseudomonas protegens TaxID=380021 RepID=UPI00209AB6D5|nr:MULTISPECIES: Mor transcription activator family protein [Pseudomonas chlororaphis group]MCO7612907.1 DNA-binding protein [Pseudomonas chlororaphis]MDS9879406.1 Mor transcription activator family protein [Pseudomonas protegens]